MLIDGGDGSSSSGGGSGEKQGTVRIQVGIIETYGKLSIEVSLFLWYPDTCRCLILHIRQTGACFHKRYLISLSLRRCPPIFNLRRRYAWQILVSRGSRALATPLCAVAVGRQAFLLRSIKLKRRQHSGSDA